MNIKELLAALKAAEASLAEAVASGDKAAIVEADTRVWEAGWDIRDWLETAECPLDELLALQ